MSKVSAPSIAIAPRAGLVSLESLRVAASAVGLSSEHRHLRVTIVSCNPVRAKVGKYGMDSKRELSRY
jgi:hypothetical protein